MNEYLDYSNNIMTNFKSLAKSIGSAQSNIFRCKSTLKCIEEELIYLNVNSNTNTNNRDFKKVPILSETVDHIQIPASMVEIDAEPPKTMDLLNRNFMGDLGNKTIKSRSYPKISISQNPDNHNSTFMKNTNGCNISGELNNLMKAQHRLICQIDQLKCEIRDKAGSIDVCLKDNQYFNCKFKELESDIDMLKREIDKIKKDQAVPSIRDRGYSPYSQDSCQKEMLNLPTSVRRSADRLHGLENHFGYQDICTPDTSLIAGPMHSKNNRNLLVNFRDPQGNSRTFEDLLKKNKLDIDCNINNCRNNQNMFSLIPSIQVNPVLQDFACLTNQIKNLRKMAEAIFKVNYQNGIKKTITSNHQGESLTFKTNDIAQEDLRTSSISKPNAETTLSMLNQQPRLKSSVLLNSVNYTKRDSSSESISMSSNDTTGCIYTEDQLPIHSPTLNSNYTHNNDVPRSQLRVNVSEENKPITSIKQQNKENHKIHRKSKGSENNSRKRETNVNDSLGLQCNRPSELCNCRMMKNTLTNRPVCPQCHQYLTNV